MASDPPPTDEQRRSMLTLSPSALGAQGLGCSTLRLVITYPASVRWGSELNSVESAVRSAPAELGAETPVVDHTIGGLDLAPDG